LKGRPWTTAQQGKKGFEQGPVQQGEKAFSKAQGPRDNKQLELARTTSDFSLHKTCVY
jgi:hypothetical protein